MEADHLENEPGKPIVTRTEGARFYCAVCDGAYSADTNKGYAAGDSVRLCKCRVYVSADTIKRDTGAIEARERAS